MPWEESRVLDQRVKFMAELLKNEESMTALCHAFGISRKTVTSGEIAIVMAAQLLLAI
jgi:Trp operon repressor